MAKLFKRKGKKIVEAVKSIDKVEAKEIRVQAVRIGRNGEIIRTQVIEKKVEPEVVVETVKETKKLRNIFKKAVKKDK